MTSMGYMCVCVYVYMRMDVWVCVGGRVCHVRESVRAGWIRFNCHEAGAYGAQ